MPAGERLGIFGGTFDPPHDAHLLAARAARNQLGLDRVLFVVARQPWQKQGAVVASAADRLAMSHLAFDGQDGMEVSDLEIRRDGPTYTADTLEALSEPGRGLFLIVGADAASRLASWVRSGRVRELAEIAVAPRAGYEIDEGAAIEMAPVELSSTTIREQLAAGLRPAGVNPRVSDYIAEHGLYRR